MEEIQLDNPNNVLEVTDAPLPITKHQQIKVLACAFLSCFLSIGLNQIYAIFQTAYTTPSTTILPASDISNKALIAFVGTLGSGLIWTCGPVVNHYMSRIRDLRKITLAGAVLMSLGYILASTATRTWHLLLTQGLIYGIGSSMFYFPPLAVAPEYFDARRGAAMGFILSAAGIGVLVLSPLMRLLISNIGIRWTLRFLSLFALLLSIPVVLLTPPSRSTSRHRTLINLSIAKKPAFIFQALAAFLQAAGNGVPMTFFTSFTEQIGFTVGFGAVLLGISNAVNSASRIVMGAVADRWGRQNVLVVSVAGSAGSVLAFWLVAAERGSKAWFLVYMVFYAVLAGGYNSVQPTTISELFGLQAYASVNGFVYFVRGLGAFFGSPVGGSILGSADDESQRSGTGSNTHDSGMGKGYQNLIYYDGALLTACFLCVILVRGFDAVDKGKWKWKA